MKIHIVELHATHTPTHQLDGAAVTGRRRKGDMNNASQVLSADEELHTPAMPFSPPRPTALISSDFSLFCVCVRVCAQRQEWGWLTCSLIPTYWNIYSKLKHSLCKHDFFFLSQAEMWFQQRDYSFTLFFSQFYSIYCCRNILGSNFLFLTTRPGIIT